MRRHLLPLLTALSCLLLTVCAVPAAARPATRAAARQVGRCAPDAEAFAYSDALDKATYGNATVGGLSSLAWDARSRSWASTVDNHDTDPARIWFFRDLLHPRVDRAPLVLRTSDGTPYTGRTADDEGLAVLPDGDFLISSETEPSIRVFGRDGVQKASLTVPPRFSVAPGGQATSNATLEGLTISPSGRRVVAAMEGALSGDTDARLHRFLVYDADRRGRWSLTKEVAYRTGTGQRVPEVAALDDDRLVVEEASFAAATGNAVSLYVVSGLRRARDVGGVADLSSVPRAVLHKTLVADLTTCPTLGAPAKEPQTNPLLDNIEGMALTTPVLGHHVGVSLISDDNFSATQTTRIVDLIVHLPAR